MSRWLDEKSRALGYQNYWDYLGSPHWTTIRERLFLRRGHRCEQCGRSDHLNVHHLTYARFGHEWESDLRILCENCHQKAHGKDQGAWKVLRMLAKQVFRPKKRRY